MTQAALKRALPAAHVAMRRNSHIDRGKRVSGTRYAIDRANRACQVAWHELRIVSPDLPGDQAGQSGRRNGKCVTQPALRHAPVGAFGSREEGTATGNPYYPSFCEAALH